MDTSDGMDKSWDHPWTTEEMRKKRREWSLAADAGLLKQLQQFSENVVLRANKTEEALNAFTSQLNEAAILIDNVTNTSLALANTQFIESRVQEDDIEIEKKVDTSVQESKNEDFATADLIASVSESIKQGLSIMDEKYKKMEFVDSDSEEEDDDKIELSVVLGSNDPYQDRRLPYVIGSEKWKNSRKIGLESSSSSESEQVDEEEEDSETDDDRAILQEYDIVTAPKTNTVGLSPSLVGSDYSKISDLTYMDNEKLDVISQNNVHSASESITPNYNASKVQLANNSAPKFAEELAKRLGTVRQAQKPIVVDDKSEASINRFKDDLLTPETNENILNDKSRGIYSGNTFLNDQSSENLWKEKPVAPYKNNIIPASMDVPPPISADSTKPKSEIDDLFADADSEDSDNIFSSKNTVKTIVKNKHTNSNNHPANTGSAQKKYLETIASVATSTPEININNNNLFSDDEDDGDLFSLPKNLPPNKTKPSGVSILGDILTSDVENKLSNKISRASSSGFSGSDIPGNYENSQEPARDVLRNAISNNNNINDRNSIVIARNNTENLTANNESSSSSGILIQPPGINNTGGSSLDDDFQPQMTSTRLKSEEIYRERITSDSLFTPRTRNPINATNANSFSTQLQEEQNEDTASIRQDDVFENEDLFGPPPLPKADSKAVKSKVQSLFDDSDSGDELFYISTTSSGSRSQKSSDFLTNISQHPDKSKFAQRRSLFDENIDIFGSKDSPDVDIFGIASKSARQETDFPGQKFPDSSEEGLFASNSRHTTPNNNNVEKRQGATSKKNSLFDDNEDIDDGDLFAAKPIKYEVKTQSRVFNNDDKRDLFSVKNMADTKQANIEQSVGITATGTETVVQDTSTRKTERKDTDNLSSNGLFSTIIGSHGLVFEDDDYDDLFSSKSVTADERKKSEELMSKIKDPIVEKISVEDTETSNDSKIFADNQEPSMVSDVVSSNVEPRSEKVTLQVTSEELGATENIESKKSPPKSLNIQITTSSSPPSEENSLAARRTVSGKIKNLMGKMGDLKILSPMDTPPLWRRSEEKTDEEDSVADRDSDDGGCISTQGHSSPPSVSEDSTTQKQSLQSTVSGESNVESAISFDEPAQVETLSTAASKTRVRIQVKRRPQSRHARKSALRQSGIDFDTVDASGNNSQDESHSNQSSTSLNKESSSSLYVNTSHNVAGNSDRLISSTNDNVYRLADPNISLIADDKSDLGSISKESSMSANKNTLLSPSTDEEDLFDVPPDLPEDPQKEDTLFGRAPILSPVDRVLSEKALANFKPLKDTHIKRIHNRDSASEKDDTLSDKTSQLNTLSESKKYSDINTTDPCEKDSKFDNVDSKDESKEVVDPLRDSNHDPLKDPSQLFAFVTKTPSPEKGKNLLFSEDDSLFSSGVKRPPEEQSVKKPMLDLFADDTEGDLFSVSVSKPVKKPLKDTKISLFEDDGQDDEDDNLFGLVKKSSVKTESEKKQSAQQPKKKISLFDDSDDTDLFSEQSEQSQILDSASVQEQLNKNDFFSSITEPVKTSHITDIFADQSSGEDDIFATKSIPKKTVTSKSLFLSDDDDDDSNIFGKKSSTSEPRAKSMETRSTIKKSVTRDLKKTVEKIGEDPLSILQDD
ncbi:PWP1 homolog no child left behind [Colletes latitarsis]|uniref:PWP1 homolog no child left behind n=1 Tax=Colletes latitarsis TaxID=2605962 RepID=UPI0040372584